MSSTSMSPELHPDFYFDDSLVVIQVENTLFRVHKFQLNKSETFSNMFKMPQVPSNEPEEGASRENPIVLEGVKASDFAALLKMLYAFQYSKKVLKSETDIISPAFRLAHMWDFSELRDYLLPLIKDSLGCVDKIILARELGLHEWLAPAFVELCQRDELPTLEEATKLGMPSIMMIFRLREEYRALQSPLRSGHIGNYCTSCLNMEQWNGEGGLYGKVPGCEQCDSDLLHEFHRLTIKRSSRAPLPSGRLENRVKEWIEGGFITE